jgi:hypothetical protein
MFGRIFFGTAVRFAILAGWLSKAGILPEIWRRWMFDTNSRNHLL